MRKLTERGIKLRKILEDEGIKIIETYPGAIQDILKIPRKNKGKERLMLGLRKFGLKGLKKRMSNHELDAATCALLGKMYLEGNYIAIGDPEEILMILPKMV
jgi:predicted nuclease with RNAse H fold